MNIRLLCALILAALLQPAVVCQSVQPPLITVSASAEVKVAPDEIHLRLGVETFHEELGQAKKENDDRVGKATAFLKTSKIRGEDIQTDYIAVEPSYADYPTRRKFVHYVVQRSIEVKLKEVNRFEALLTGLLTNGVTHVHGIEFRTSELRKHRDTARALATRAAREKAEALATELGVRRGKVHNLTANEWGGWWSSTGGSWGHRYDRGSAQTSLNAGAPSESGDNTLSLGQISVSATVNVSFLIDE